MQLRRVGDPAREQRTLCTQTRQHIRAEAGIRLEPLTVTVSLRPAPHPRKHEGSRLTGRKAPSNSNSRRSISTALCCPASYYSMRDHSTVCSQGAITAVGSILMASLLLSDLDHVTGALRIQQLARAP